MFKVILLIWFIAAPGEEPRPVAENEMPDMASCMTAASSEAMRIATLAATRKGPYTVGIECVLDMPKQEDVGG